jgi:hypothetical protein
MNTVVETKTNEIKTGTKQIKGMTPAEFAAAKLARETSGEKKVKSPKVIILAGTPEWDRLSPKAKIQHALRSRLADERAKAKAEIEKLGGGKVKKSTTPIGQFVRNEDGTLYFDLPVSGDFAVKALVARAKSLFPEVIVTPSVKINTTNGEISTVTLTNPNGTVSAPAKNWLGQFLSGYLQCQLDSAPKK